MPKQGHMEYMKGQNSEVQPQLWKNISYREKNKENNLKQHARNNYEQHVQRLFFCTPTRDLVPPNFGWAPFFVLLLVLQGERICSFVFISVQSGFSIDLVEK